MLAPISFVNSNIDHHQSYVQRHQFQFPPNQLCTDRFIAAAVHFPFCLYGYAFDTCSCRSESGVHQTELHTTNAPDTSARCGERQTSLTPGPCRHSPPRRCCRRRLRQCRLLPDHHPVCWTRIVIILKTARTRPSNCQSTDRVERKENRMHGTISRLSCTPLQCFQ